MKNVLIFLCTLCIALCAVVRADNEVPTPCLERMGITLADIPSLIRDNSDEGIRKRGCLEACVMQKVGLMNGNTIDMQKIEEQIEKTIDDSENKENVRQSVKQCADQAANDDECLVAQSFAKCGLEQMKIRLQQLMGNVA